MPRLSAAMDRLKRSHRHFASAGFAQQRFLIKTIPFAFRSGVATNMEQFCSDHLQLCRRLHLRPRRSQAQPLRSVGSLRRRNHHLFHLRRAQPIPVLHWPYAALRLLPKLCHHLGKSSDAGAVPNRNTQHRRCMVPSVRTLWRLCVLYRVRWHRGHGGIPNRRRNHKLVVGRACAYRPVRPGLYLRASLRSRHQRQIDGPTRKRGDGRRAQRDSPIRDHARNRCNPLLLVHRLPTGNQRMVQTPHCLAAYGHRHAPPLRLLLHLWRKAAGKGCGKEVTRPLEPKTNRAEAQSIFGPRFGVVSFSRMRPPLTPHPYKSLKALNVLPLSSRLQ